MRSEFEKAYEPNPHKSPFTEVRFNEEKQIYEPLNPPRDRVARSLNAAWYGYRIRQTEVDELQKRVDSTLKVVQSMRNEVKHGHLSDDESQTLSGYANDLEQALKGGDQNTEKQPNKHAENIATKGVKGGDQ